jgi:uridine kinase
MTKHIESQLHENIINLRWGLLDTPLCETIPDTVSMLPTTNQIKVRRRAKELIKHKLIVLIQGIHTILRDRRTGRDEFIFYADRLAVLLMEQ